MIELSAFIDKLRAHPRVFIQAHDFPDHDAVASSFALSDLLSQLSIPSQIIYNGSIDRGSIHTMVEECGIDICNWQDSDISPDDITITVDGCIGEKNVFDTPGQEIAVIDHHEVTAPKGLWFCDVRPNYGAAASMLVEYYSHLKLPIRKEVASALQIGLNIDTAHLTRGFCSADIQAFSTLHALSDMELVNKVCKNTLESEDLTGFKDLLNEATINNRVAFAYLEHCNSKNILGILGDFLLSVEEIDVTIIAATLEDKIHLSLRSEVNHCDVAALVRTVLNDSQLGFGGGHNHMAGGVVTSNDILSDANPAQKLSGLFFEKLPS